MSVANLLEENNYKLWVDAENLKLDGSQPKGTIVVSDGDSLKPVSVGTNGQALIADSAAPNGVRWDNIVIPPNSIGYAKLTYSDLSSTTDFTITKSYSNVPVGTTLIQNRSFSNPSPGVITNNGAAGTFIVKAIFGFRTASAGNFDLDFVISRSGSPQNISAIRYTASSGYQQVICESIVNIGNGQNIALAARINATEATNSLPLSSSSNFLILTQL
jgi:hypothetical protein